MRHPPTEEAAREASNASVYRPSALARRQAHVPADAPVLAIQRPSTYLIITGLTVALLAVEVALWAFPIRRESSWPAVVRCDPGIEPSCRVTASVSAAAWRQRDPGHPIQFSDGTFPVAALKPVCDHSRLSYFVPVTEAAVRPATGRVRFMLRPAPLFVVASPVPDGQLAEATCCNTDEPGCEGGDRRSPRP